MVMKKLLFLILSVALSVTFANAQDSNVVNGKVILKNGSVIEGTISNQGDDVMVTTATGDVFYYSAAEIGRVIANKEMADMYQCDFRSFKKNTKDAYREAKAFGTDINQYWGTNDRAKYYYDKSRKIRRAAYGTAISGALLSVAGTAFLFADNDWVWVCGLALLPVGGAMLLTSCFIPIGSYTNLKRSYEYYTRDGKSHSAVFNASPVLYAQGGAGIGVKLTF